MTTPRTLSVFDRWLLNEQGEVVGLLLTNSSIPTLFSDPVILQNKSLIDFNTAAGMTAGEGQLTWNAQEETLDLGLADGVTLQIGQETHYHVENKTGSTIAEGTLVVFAGTTGNSGKLLVAPWVGTQPGFSLMGIATSTIENGTAGYVTHFGKVRGIQTDGANYGETWANGDVLYAGPTGGLTKVKPTAPHVKATIAAVISAHPSNGELFVRPQLGSSLGDDELVELSTPVNRDVIQYRSSTGRFENGPVIPVAAASITPEANRDVAFELTNDTTLTIKVKGADGIVRSVALTLA